MKSAKFRGKLDIERGYDGDEIELIDRVKKGKDIYEKTTDLYYELEKFNGKKIEVTIKEIK